MRLPRRCSSLSFFHPSTNRRMYMFASNGEMGEPCGMPHRLSRASVVRVFLPRSSVSSTGHSSHILIRCSTRRSTTPRATDCNSSAWGDASEVVREVGVNDFRVATEQQLFHLDHRLLGIAPGTVCVL